MYLPKGKKVQVKGTYTRAIEPLTGREITISKCNEYTEVILPEIEGFMMVVLFE